MKVDIFIAARRIETFLHQAHNGKQIRVHIRFKVHSKASQISKYFITQLILDMVY